MPDEFEDPPFDESDDDTDAGHPEGEFDADDVEPADEGDDDGED